MFVRNGIYIGFILALAALTPVTFAQTTEDKREIRLGPKPPDQIVTVRAEDPSIDIKSFVELVNRVRSTDGIEVKVILPKGIPLIVAQRLLPDDRINVKPNPLTLVVSVDATGKVELNNEDHGDISDTSSLVVRLVEIFKRREENGVFRNGSNDVEKAVSLKLDESLKISDLEKVATAVRDSGSDLIGLRVDDDTPETVDHRRDLYMPQMPKKKRRPSL